MFCGIDFGTSNSTIGTVIADVPQLIDLEDGKSILPSAIFFSEEEEEIFIGRTAIEEYVSGHEGRFMRSIKSALGTSLLDEKTRVGRSSMTLRQIILTFLRHAKKTAEDKLGRDLTQLVQGRPVRFVNGSDTDNQKAQDQLESVLREIGFKDIEFQFEPVAAARCIDGVAQHRKTVFVADIGGGTSDFTIIRFDEGTGLQGRVLANHGIRLGGTDFDYSLNFKHVQPLFGRGMVLDHGSGLVAPSWIYRTLSFWPEINTAYNPKTFECLRWMKKQAPEAAEVTRLQKIVDGRYGHKVALDAEGAKISLSDADSTTIDLTYLEPNLHPSFQRAQLQDAIADQLSELKQAVQETLTLAAVSDADIDVVLMTGGSTGMPSVERTIMGCMPHSARLDGDRMAAVGTGLTLEAKQLFG